MQSKHPKRIGLLLLGCLFCMATHAELNIKELEESDTTTQVEQQEDVPFSDELELSDDESDAAVAEVPITQIRNFIEVFDMVKQNYVAAVTDDELFENALHGLVEELDPYSRYLDAAHYQQLLEFTEGDIAEPNFSLKFNRTSQLWLLDDIGVNSANYRQGLRNGYVVEKINGVRLQSLDQKKLSQILMGSLGSSIKFELNIAGKLQIIEALRDRKISYDVEPYLTNDQILVIKIKAFQQNTTQQVQEILKLYQQQTVLRGLLIDIRDNPGGLLAASVDLADLFLEQGLIVTTRGRIEAPQRFQALPGAISLAYPVAILQNRYSASAAEVFAAAMKEQGRARILGERSYGKGAVQKLFPLKQGALQLTVSHYYTPQGHLIEGKGIEPDDVLTMGSDFTDQQILQNALDTFNRRLPAVEKSDLFIILNISIKFKFL